MSAAEINAAHEVKAAHETNAAAAGVKRVILHTPAATIDGPCCLGPVADPRAVRDAVIRWAAAEYERNPAKRAWIDARVLKESARVLPVPGDTGTGATEWV